MCQNPFMTTLTCLSCDETKPESEFGVDRKRRTGRHPYCKVCRRVQARERYRANPEARVDQRWRQIKCTYGVTKDQWMAKYEEQQGCCAICLHPIPLITEA